MPQRDTTEDEERTDLVIHANYELFVFGFLLVQLINSALLWLPLHNEQHEIVFEFWVVISVFILADALNRLRRSPNRRRWLFSYYGWLTWVGSLPIPFVTIARIVATALLLRKLRRGEFSKFRNVVVTRHAQSTLYLVIYIAVLIFEFSSLMILSVEQNSSVASITTSEDATWWSIVTISTVGYGDVYPTTEWGRRIGIVLIITGVGLFTSTTSFLARWFMRPRKRPEQRMESDDTVPAPQDQVREIRSLLDQLEEDHQQTMSDIENRLQELEKAVADDGERS